MTQRIRIPLTRAQAREHIRAVERALADGNPPPGHKFSNTQRSALRIAAEALGVVNEAAMRRRVGTPTDKIPGGAIRRAYPDLPMVNWSLYRPKSDGIIDDAELTRIANLYAEHGSTRRAFKPSGLSREEFTRRLRLAEARGVVAPPPPPPDPVETERERKKGRDLAAENKALRDRVIAAEDIRKGVLGLTEDPLRPQIVLPPQDGSHTSGGRTVILHLSDVHYGEFVDLAEMDGLNQYNTGIAQARLGRFFSAAADLMTKYWKGEPPDEIILCLGGDLISGNIHAELEQTNDVAVPASVREVGEHIAGGIQRLAKRVQRPIRVYSVPGNHGRMTMKPQSKGRAAGSLDLLATDFAEATLKGARVDNVTWYRTSSPDAYFSVYGWHFLLTHGDAMGGRGGGTGFIGPMAAIIKGHRKLVDTSWRSGRPVHFVLTGHYHTTGKTTFGWSNGSVVSYGEYARDLRADPEAASANMIVVHPRRGWIQWDPLYLGAENEGSLYAGPASVVRPKWGGGGMTALRITPEMCALYWDALMHTPPFDAWNMPLSEEIDFKVFRRPNWYGYYTRDKGGRSGYTIGIGPKVGAVLTLIGTLGHEAIHLHMDRNRMDTRVEHNRAFRILAADVARIQGFDPMCY